MVVEVKLAEGGQRSYKHLIFQWVRGVRGKPVEGETPAGAMDLKSPWPLGLGSFAAADTPHG